MKPHKHAALIHAWAEGAEIEWRRNNKWLPNANLNWREDREYRIKPKQQEWYKDIPEHGVLCWVSDNEKQPDSRNCWARVIDLYRPNESFPFKQIKERSWRYATPLTNDEIRQFLRVEQ